MNEYVDERQFAQKKEYISSTNALIKFRKNAGFKYTKRDVKNFFQTIFNYFGEMKLADSPSNKTKNELLRWVYKTQE